MARIRRTAALLQAFSIPLILGVLAALIAANVAPEWYAHATHWSPLPGWTLFGHPLTLHFVVNDLFMVLFFGVAAKEITEACLPGGSLNPPRKAVNPLMGTVGGVIGPVAVFLGGLWVCVQLGMVPAGETAEAIARGWGVPTATDIALAWLVARAVFGAGHPAVSFLLLLAVADDALGLGIIAVFYGDPAHPAQPAWLGLVVAGMAVAWGLRRAGVKQWAAYLVFAGPLAWSGLLLAHLHPALALVFVVPFMPGPTRDTGLFVAEDEVDVDGHDAHGGHDHSPLHLFEHQVKGVVDFGLFFFAFANAGVALGGTGPVTVLILVALVVGKTVGVTAMSLLAVRMGFPLPEGMGRKELAMAGFVGALGLTVALFVSGAAFFDAGLLGQAKMGALLSAGVAPVAILAGRLLGIRRISAAESAAAAETGEMAEVLSVQLAQAEVAWTEPEEDARNVA